MAQMANLVGKPIINCFKDLFGTNRHLRLFRIQMFLIQISMNLNASLYANGVTRISEKFSISEQAARVPQLTFLCAYAFACEVSSCPTLF
jgi:hypothetical protein